MNTIENNELLGRFNGGDDFGISFIDHDTDMYYSYAEAKYHCSWDWLIPVTKKVLDKWDGTTYFSEGNLEGVIVDSLKIADIEGVYKSVVKFIKWYNLNK